MRLGQSTAGGIRSSLPQSVTHTSFSTCHNMPCTTVVTHSPLRTKMGHLSLCPCSFTCKVNKRDGTSRNVHSRLGKNYQLTLKSVAARIDSELWQKILLRVTTKKLLLGGSPFHIAFWCFPQLFEDLTQGVGGRGETRLQSHT